jgi:hypothetical protein
MLDLQWLLCCTAVLLSTRPSGADNFDVRADIRVAGFLESFPGTWRTEMKRCTLLLVVMATAIASAPAAIAQTFPPTCNPLPQDRSITFCYPIDDATIAQPQTQAEGWIKDSLPHTAQEYADGRLELSNVPDEFEGVGIGGSFDDKIHTFTIVVTDSQGSFQKSVSFRLSLQLPCALPSTDPGLVVCTPSAGEVDSRPMRIAAVASSSTGFDNIQVWIDGKKYDSSHAGTANVKMLNNFYYVPVGTHKLSIFAERLDGTKITKQFKLTVVSYMP